SGLDVSGPYGPNASEYTLAFRASILTRTASPLASANVAATPSVTDAVSGGPPARDWPAMSRTVALTEPPSSPSAGILSVRPVQARGPVTTTAGRDASSGANPAQPSGRSVARQR